MRTDRSLTSGGPSIRAEAALARDDSKGTVLLPHTIRIHGQGLGYSAVQAEDRQRALTVRPPELTFLLKPLVAVSSVPRCSFQ